MNKKRYFRTKIEALSRDLSSYAALYEFDTDKYKAKKNDLRARTRFRVS